MRVLFINGVQADIDEQTAIGLNFQGWDIKSPAQRRVNVSNAFTLPKTVRNMNIIGFAGNPYSNKKTVYSFLTVDYFIDSKQLVKNGKGSVISINERIEFQIVQKSSIWDELKKVSWGDFTNGIIEWLQNEKGLPSATNPSITPLFNTFINPYINGTERVFLPWFYSNLVNPVELYGGVLESGNVIVLKKATGLFGQALGGHFCLYAKAIFEYLEHAYNVNFYTSSVLNGNIWDDPIASSVYIPFRELDVKFFKSGGVTTGYYFQRAFIDPSTGNAFMPFDGVFDKGGKTVYDFVNAFFQHFGVLVDEHGANIKLRRFDAIKNLAPVVDFSKNISGSYLFKPAIDGFGQQSIIKFKSVYDGGGKLENAKILECKNETINGKEDLFEIDAHVPGVIFYNNQAVLDLSTQKSFETFIFLTSYNLTKQSVFVKVSDNSEDVILTLDVYPAALYSLSSEYTFLEEIIDYPKYYEVSKWLTIADLKGLDFFAQYYIKELGGSFFLNKIEGFNPDRSKQPTKLQLIYLSSKTPITPPDLDYFTDGTGDGFTDGTGDLFF